MFSRDGRDGGVIEHPLPGLDEWTVRLYYNPILVTITHDLSLLTERVKLAQMKRFEMSWGYVTWESNQRSYLDLVHGRELETRIGDLFEVVNAATSAIRSKL